MFPKAPLDAPPADEFADPAPVPKGDGAGAAEVDPKGDFVSPPVVVPEEEGTAAGNDDVILPNPPNGDVPAGAVAPNAEVVEGAGAPTGAPNGDGALIAGAAGAGARAGTDPAFNAVLVLPVDDCKDKVGT